jgi:hypothetical protein
MIDLNDMVFSFVLRYVRGDAKKTCCDVLLFKNVFYLQTKVWKKNYIKN